MQHTRALVREPGLDHGNRIFHSERFWKNCAPSRKADKAEKSHPRQADASRLIERRFEPASRCLVSIPRYPEGSRFAGEARIRRLQRLLADHADRKLADGAGRPS